MASLWSCGGGTQSAAIAALIVSGRLEAPDLSVIVDTEREKSSTWAYVDGVLVPALAAVGVTLQRVRKSEYATVDLWSTKGDLLIPAFTGSGGRLSGFCSNEWKKRVVQRWARAQGAEQVTAWMGFSTDEPRRVKAPEMKWWQLRYPLIEQGLNRGACVRLVEAMGWPTPPRSACWMCPHMQNTEWRDLRDTAPADFAKAVALDALIREEDADAFLHRSGTPLATADLGAPDTQMTLGCDSGNCFV